MPNWNYGAPFYPQQYYGWGGRVYVQPVLQQWYAPMHYGPQFYSPIWNYNIGR